MFRVRSVKLSICSLRKNLKIQIVDKMKKKLYLVKREVLATSVAQALIARGEIYEVSLAADNLQPVIKKKSLGFMKTNA